MRAYIRKAISNTVGEDMLDPYRCKLLDEAITRRIKSCEAEADGSFNREIVFTARLKALNEELDRDMAASRASMVLAGETLLAKERAAINAAHEQELLTLRNTLKVQRAEEKDLSDSAIAASVAHHSSRLATRVSKTPTALNNKKKKVHIGGKRKASALNLNTPSPEPDNNEESSSEYEYAQSTTSEASHMADKSPMVEDKVLAPSSINKNDHTPTLGGWFTTPEPLTPTLAPAIQPEL
jgi:hypothetical protein